MNNPSRSLDTRNQTWGGQAYVVKAWASGRTSTTWYNKADPCTKPDFSTELVRWCQSLIKQSLPFRKNRRDTELQLIFSSTVSGQLSFYREYEPWAPEHDPAPAQLYFVWIISHVHEFLLLVAAKHTLDIIFIIFLKSRLWVERACRPVFKCVNNASSEQGLTSGEVGYQLTFVS